MFDYPTTSALAAYLSELAPATHASSDAKYDLVQLHSEQLGPARVATELLAVSGRFPQPASCPGEPSPATPCVADDARSHGVSYLGRVQAGRSTSLWATVRDGGDVQTDTPLRRD